MPTLSVVSGRSPDPRLRRRVGDADRGAVPGVVPDVVPGSEQSPHSHLWLFLLLTDPAERPGWSHLHKVQSPWLFRSLGGGGGLSQLSPGPHPPPGISVPGKVDCSPSRPECW